MLVVCERWVGDGDRLLHIDPSSSDNSSTSFSSWLGLLNRGSLRAKRPLSAAGSHFGILSPTDSNWLEPSRAPGYIIVSRTPASAVLPLIYTGASLDWRFVRGSICYTCLLKKINIRIQEAKINRYLASLIPQRGRREQLKKRKRKQDYAYTKYWKWFRLVSLFNGVSSFVGYVMPKSPL